MNLYYYLFYKLSQYLNKKGNNEWGPIYAITSIILMNIIFIYVKVFDISEENSQGPYKTILGIAILFVFIINAILFKDRRRTKEITDIYKGESMRSRKIGNAAVLAYVLFSLCLIVFL
jgi:amino acid permease